MSYHTDVWITCQNRELATELANALNEWGGKQDHVTQFYAVLPDADDTDYASEVCAVVGGGNHLDVVEMWEIIKPHFAVFLGKSIMYYEPVVVVLRGEDGDYYSVNKLDSEGKWIL